jgi:hypothetical protein
MEELKFNSTGTDAAYLGHANIFLTALFGLDIFRHDWREDKLGSQGVLQKTLDMFRQTYEGGLTGNRLQIAARNQARKDLNVKIRKILSYLTIFGDESDITLMLSSGVVTRKSRMRARRAAKPAPAS